MRARHGAWPAVSRRPLDRSPLEDDSRPIVGCHASPGAARGAPTTYFRDPDVLSVDEMFDDLAQPNAPIQRLWTGALWAEGPAWSGQGRYLVWSDIPNNRQLRWLQDDGRVTVFRSPSNNSNGN